MPKVNLDALVLRIFETEEKLNPEKIQLPMNVIRL